MTAMLNHTDIQPLLADYRDLRGAERRAVDEHIATCDLCAGRLADYQAMDTGIQSLRNAPPDPRLRARYYGALAGAEQPAPRVRRAWPYALAATAVTLLLVVGALMLLHPSGIIPRRVSDGDIPAAKSAEVGQFIWQTDGVYGYRALRPAGWDVNDAGMFRDYVAPSIGGQPAPVLHIVNLRAKPWAEIPGGMDAYLSLFESAPTLEGWSANVRQSILGGVETVDVGAESADVIVWSINDGSGDRVMLMALKVSQGDPLIMALETRFTVTDLDALRTSGMQDDFVTMVNSLSAAPFDVASVSPWAPTATPAPTEPPRTPLPTSEPAVAATATLAVAAVPTFDLRLTIWPNWQAFEQALGDAIFGAQVGNRVCDWAVLGRNGNDIYVWATCAAYNPAPDFTAASLPAVLRVSENNAAVGALVPRDGTYYSEDVRTLFPAEMQAQIFSLAPGTASPALERHAQLRLNWPMLPPLGAAEVAPTDPDAAAAKASIRIFSGRPDPNWMLTQRDLLALDGFLRELESIQCPPIPDRLGYRGAQVILGPGDAGYLVAAEGYVWPGDAASNSAAQCLADPDRSVERFLLSSSQPYVDADTFNLLSTLLTEPLPTPLVTPTPTPTLAPGWVMYGDEGLDIQLRHPDMWEVGTTTDYSRVWQMRVSPAGEALAAPPFWVTILAPGYDNADAQAYNFWSAEEVNRAWNTPPGETFVNPHAPEGYNVYTRYPHMAVDGFPAILVENRMVWEAPTDTKDARVFVRIGGMTVMFGSYYTYEEEYVAFMRALESVKFGSGLITGGAFALTPQPAPAPTAAP